MKSRLLQSAAREFAPHAVFTVAGTWDPSALVAKQISNLLGVPLIASFNDWYNFGWFPPHSLFHDRIEKRFRKFYTEADLALCTSEGMREELGPHPNAHILYPTGARPPANNPPFKPFDPCDSERKIVVGFAGSLSEWYGPMLERLVVASESAGSPLEFRFFGSHPAWSAIFDAHVRSAKVYQGVLPFKELQSAMDEVDALLLPMGFETRAALIERTSFKTKFLDYLVFRKPIMIWGPTYCSAVRTAREFDSAQICSDEDENAALKTLMKLSKQPERQKELVENAAKMHFNRFHPDLIHAGLVERIEATVKADGAGMRHN